MHKYTVGAFCAAISLSCSAQSLSNLLDLARASEPTYLGARTGVEAAQARTDQALGALLPQLSATASTNANHRYYQTRIAGTLETEDRYNNNSSQLTLTQPLWHYANIAGYQEAKAAMAQARRQLDNTEQELFAKLVSAWLDVLAARDDVEFTAHQEAATRKQWQIARRGVELGTAGLPQSEEARAKYDQARSDAMAAENDAQVKLATLEQLVGPLREFHAPVMSDDAILADLSGGRIEKWLDAIDTGNPSVLAAQRGFEAADAEVRKQRAGHQPTVDLVASYSRNSQAVGGFPGQAGYDIKQSAVGLQLNVPLFSGGTQSAKVSEAVAMKEKARLDIEAARRAAALAVKQAWFGWRAASIRTEAGLQSVKAARAALRAARLGQETGLKMELDVLQAEQQLWGALRDWRKGRYDQVAAHVKLKAAVGMATAKDIAALDKLFVAADNDMPAREHDQPASGGAAPANQPPPVRKMQQAPQTEASVAGQFWPRGCRWAVSADQDCWYLPAAVWRRNNPFAHCLVASNPPLEAPVPMRTCAPLAQVVQER